jgi:ferric-dicitrate binding protein FerR (iron transport regulator)
LRDAAAELQRYFNTIDDIIVAEQIKNKTITGVFETGSLDNILSVFSLTMDIKVTMSGRQIYFE